jgi:hypothetical protein
MNLDGILMVFISKKRQREILQKMEAHVDSLLTIKAVVNLARRAKEIYLSSNLDEKRELLNLVFSNLKLGKDCL